MPRRWARMLNTRSDRPVQAELKRPPRSSGAARCRKAARSSTDPKEWLVMAEQREWLADTADGSWQLPSKGRHNGVIAKSVPKRTLSRTEELGARVS